MFQQIPVAASIDGDPAVDLGAIKVANRSTVEIAGMDSIPSARTMVLEPVPSTPDFVQFAPAAPTDGACPLIARKCSSAKTLRFPRPTRLWLFETPYNNPDNNWRYDHRRQPNSKLRTPTALLLTHELSISCRSCCAIVLRLLFVWESAQAVQQIEWVSRAGTRD